MGGTITTLYAGTKTELKREVQQWIRDAKGAGLKDIRLGWDPKRVVKTSNGYGIHVWAHS